MPMPAQSPASKPEATPTAVPMAIDLAIGLASSPVTADAVVADITVLDQSTYGSWPNSLLTVSQDCVRSKSQQGCFQFISAIYDVYRRQGALDPKLQILLEDSIGFAKTVLSSRDFATLEARLKAMFAPQPLAS
jgi:hypothetical protein